MQRLQFVLLPALVVLAFSCSGILGFLTAIGFAQGQSAGRPEYVANCGSCHGRNGNGDGPAREALRAPPPDLTLLAKNNDGVFPGEVLHQIIDGRRTLRAHGNYEMPVWGSSINQGTILAIIEHLRTLQVN
jgi:mono/diheme cytochrome c family protein